MLREPCPFDTPSRIIVCYAGVFSIAAAKCSCPYTFTYHPFNCSKLPFVCLWCRLRSSIERQVMWEFGNVALRRIGVAQGCPRCLIGSLRKDRDVDGLSRLIVRRIARPIIRVASPALSVASLLAMLFLWFGGILQLYTSPHALVRALC